MVFLVVAEDQRMETMEVDGDEEETRRLREEAIRTTEKKQREDDGTSEGRGSNRGGGFLVRAMQGFEKIMCAVGLLGVVTDGHTPATYSIPVRVCVHTQYLGNG
jgi:hypothetical protein